MSYSSRKDKERDYATGRGQGSHHRSEDFDFEDDDSDHDYHPQKYDERKEDRDREDRYNHEKQRKYDRYHETYSTKAIQRQHAGTEIYPPNDASNRAQYEAALTRRNTRIDGNDEKFALDEKRAARDSRESEERMAGLREQGIQVRDFAYRPDDYRHRQPGDPNRRPSLDRDAIARWNRERKGKGRAET